MKYIKATILTILCTVFLHIEAGSSYTRIIDFYGHPLTVSYDPQLSSLKFRKWDQAEISRNLSVFRNSNLSISVNNLKRHIVIFDLDGTATTLLIDKYARQISRANDKNTTTFIKYIFLKELNYDVILTKTGTDLNCMGNLNFTPGRYIFIKYANKTYKDLDYTNRKNKGKHLIFMDKKITTKRISHTILSLPLMNAKLKNKDISFIVAGDTFMIKVKSNGSIIEFLGDLPMFDVGNYFTDAPMSPEMDSSLMKYLKQQIKGRELIDQVKFLLAFVQQVVPYGSDYDKYGEERFYYPEETIMSASSDCEDKVMLMSYLTHNILGLKSIGLFFKQDEHLSLGIEIPGYAPHGSFNYSGKTYVSCEPTAPAPRIPQSQFSLQRVDEVIEF